MAYGVYCWDDPDGCGEDKLCLQRGFRTESEAYGYAASTGDDCEVWEWRPGKNGIGYLGGTRLGTAPVRKVAGRSGFDVGYY